MEEPAGLFTIAGAADAAGDEAADSERIADQFEVLAQASCWLRSELEHIMTCRTLLSQVTVNRLVALGERIRPAAAAREQLAGIEPARLYAGGAVWLARQPPPMLQESAAVRAARAWIGGAT